MPISDISLIPSLRLQLHPEMCREKLSKTSKTASGVVSHASEKSSVSKFCVLLSILLTELLFVPMEVHIQNSTALIQAHMAWVDFSG